VEEGEGIYTLSKNVAVAAFGGGISAPGISGPWAKYPWAKYLPPSKELHAEVLSKNFRGGVMGMATAGDTRGSKGEGWGKDIVAIRGSGLQDMGFYPGSPPPVG
jgi:hypothetical protein